MSTRLLLATIGLAIGVALAGSTAFADPAEKPWAAGVSEDRQNAAFALYKEGGALFDQDRFKDALDKYEQALAIWDHPQIRFSAALCLINLDRPVEAYENIEAALRFGEAPLEADSYKQALSYRKLLAGRVAEVDVEARSGGATITLDGQPMMQGQGSAKKHVLGGDHQIVAERPGYQTETRPVRVNGGDHVTVVIELKPVTTQGELGRRFPRWLPWAVLGGGAAVAVIGVPFYLRSKDDFGIYDNGVTAGCPHGCPPATLGVAYTNAHDSAELYKKLELVSFIAGGAIAAAGFTLVVFNQPHLVTPVVGSDHIGMMVSGRW